jgi:multiple sugar transport system permease protein
MMTLSEKLSELSSSRAEPQAQSMAKRGVSLSFLSTRKRKILWIWLFMLPQAIMFLMFTAYPVVMNVVYSFFRWNGIGALDNFIGLNNYRAAIADPLFWQSVRNTLGYAFGEMSIQLPLALLLAIVLNSKNLPGRNFYRAAYFLPAVTTSAVIGIVMVWIWGSGNGVVNTVFLNVGLLDRAIDWLGDGRWALRVIILVGVWQTLGVKMIYWITGLQSIPDELYDAAQVDGAGWFNTLRFITLPLLAKVAVVIVLISSRGALHIFDLVQTMTKGGPGFATQSVDMYVYRYAFGSSAGQAQMGYSAAVSVMFSVAVIGFGLFLTYLARRARQLTEE